MRLASVAVTLVLAASLAACGTSGTAPVESASSSGEVASTLKGFVGYDIVRPEDQEDYFGGDEPFVAVLRIRSTTGVPGSTKWAWVTDDPQEPRSVRAGKEASIPDGSGDAWFEGDLAVRPLEETQFIGMDTNLTADVMVTLAFVFEEDAGRRATDVRVLNSLVGPVVRQVGDIVEGTKIPVSVRAVLDPKLTTDALDQLMKSLEKIKNPEITFAIVVDLIRRLLEAGGDPNDFIGVVATAFVPTTGELTKTLRSIGVTPTSIGLLDDRQGDGDQAWTNYLTFRKEHRFEVAGLSFGPGYVVGELWYGLLTDDWVEDWMAVESRYPWQDRVRYWLKLTASMRP
jgi:hypothetical protein